MPLWKLPCYCFPTDAPGSAISVRFLFSSATWQPKWLSPLRGPCPTGSFYLSTSLSFSLSNLWFLKFIPFSNVPFFSQHTPHISCYRCFYPWWTHSCLWWTLAPCHQRHLLPHPLFLCYQWALLCSPLVWLWISVINWERVIGSFEDTSLVTFNVFLVRLHHLFFSVVSNTVSQW